MDVEGGYTYWKSLPEDRCVFNRYGLLYEGLATRITDVNLEFTQTVYTLNAEKITFGLTAKGRENVCGYTLIRTEHPKLIVVETIKGESFAKKGQVLVDNLDIFAYVNSKFVYAEKHMRTQTRLDKTR